MNARWLLAVIAALALPACLDPIVGSKCATGYSPCHGACMPDGTCATIDASDEAGGGVDAEALDAGIDLGAFVDAGGLDVGVVDAESLDAAGVPAVDATLDSAVDTAVVAPADAPADGPVDAPIDAPVDAPVDLPTRDLAIPDAPSSDDATTPDVPMVEDLAPTLVVDADIDSGVDSADADCVGCLDAEQIDADIDAGANEDGGEDANQDAGDDASDDVGDDASNDTELVCPDSQLVCSNQCVDPAVDPENCGDCSIICATGVCLQGACLVCGSDESVCGQTCVNTATDPDNCGGCGNPCMSGLCSNGVCEAAGTGRVIVIGHDYLNNRPAMNRILGNAVFLWPVNPVRLLTYQGGADPAAVAGADAAIAQVAAATGRLATRTSATTVEVPTLLASNDVFLVYAQEQSDDATLLALGQTWASALDTFVNNGGTVVVLDAVSASNSGTSQILVEAGLFDLAASASATNDVCTVVARGDALATGLPRTYLCERNSMTFTVTDLSTTITSVVEDTGKPVVLHKVF